MSRYAIKFPFRVRIHGGEFDESARAIHREDGLKTIQAESGIVLGSTIERKQMSTKTTFKRIALVTVAALGFGVMSVAPSNAAAAGNPLGVTHTLSASTTTVNAGTAAKTILTTAGYFTGSDSTTSVVALATFSAGTTAAGITEALSPAFTAIDTATATTNGDGTVSAGGSSQFVTSSKTVEVGLAGATKLVSTRTQLAVTLNVPGTYTYLITNTIGDTSTATVANGRVTSLTWTVVVNAQDLLGATAFINTTTGSVATADSTTLTGSGTASATPVARISVKQYQDAAKTLSISTGSSKAVTVAVSGAGAVDTVSSNGATRGPSVTIAAAAGSDSEFYLFADGRTGTATVTITAGTIVTTKTFKFLGTMTTMSATASKNNVGVGETMTLTAAGADANGNATATPTVTAASSDATIATVTASGEVATVTGVKAGTATITLTSGTVTKAVSVTVLPVTAPKLSWTFDKDNYDAGEKMTLTVTASGVADGARAAFAAAPVANFSLASGSATLEASPTFVAGVKTYTLYAPATPGKFTLTATVGAAIDTEAVIIAAAGTRTVVTLSATITNPALTAAQEATDAANEATDAGNNAADLAAQAIEAADAATIAAQDAADAAAQAGQDAVDAAAEATDAANNAADLAAQAIEAADAATTAAQDAAAAAEAAGEMAVAAAEAAGAIAQDALDAANAATDAALSAAEAADAATAAATDAKESADAATAAVAELATKVAAYMASLNAKITTLSNLVAKIAKKVKA